MSGRVVLTSGEWVGHYEQHGAEYAQRMTLELADGLVRGDGVDEIGTFTLDGEYRVDEEGVRIGWVKTYDGAHSVLYVGEVDGAAIRGTWSLTGGRGRFELRPARAFGAHGGLEPYR